MYSIVTVKSLGTAKWNEVLHAAELFYAIKSCNIIYLGELLSGNGGTDGIYSHIMS